MSRPVHATSAPTTEAPLRKDYRFFVTVLVALALYLALAQRTLYGDAPGILAQIDTGDTTSRTLHFLYSPAVYGLSKLGASIGITMYWAGIILSAVGAAIGVGLSFLAALRFGLDRQQALLTAALIATCPSLMFFATVFEYHGLFFAFSGLASFQLARLTQSPSLGGGLLCGLATGLAWFAHGSGGLLPGLLILLLVTHDWNGLGQAIRSRAMISVALLAAHYATTYGGAELIRMAGWGNLEPGGSTQHILDKLYAGARPLSDFITITWIGEWIGPYFPLCVLALVGLFFHGQRAIAVAIHIALLVYLIVSFLIVLGGRNEFGAYRCRSSGQRPSSACAF